MSSVSITQSERMIAVINECIEKLQFLGAIAPDVLSHRDELTAFVGGEISRIITKQRDLESKYEKLINERGALRGLSNKTRYKEVQMEIQDVSVALRESTKSLCRNLKDNPNIAGNLSKIHRERTQLLDILTSTNAELQESGLFETLATRVTQDRTNQANQKEILRKERETAAAVKQLDVDLENERADHAQIVTEQRAEMAMLKENLLTLRTKASVDVRFQRAEANAKSASIIRFSQLNSARMPESALATRPTSANIPTGQPPGKLRRRKSLGEMPRENDTEQATNPRLDELKRRSKEEQERIEFYKTEELDDDEARAAEMDPLYYEAPPYPKELLKDELEEDEKRRKAIDDQRRRRTRKLSVTDTNKKMVSQIMANGLVEGRKVWTEEEIVQRDLDETISAFRKKRDTENWSEKKNVRRGGGGGGGGDSLDARLGKEKVVVVHDEDFDPRREIDEDAVGGLTIGKGVEGGASREFRHSRKFSTEDRILDEMVIEPVIKKKEEGKGKAERLSFKKTLRRSFRRSMDAFSRFTGTSDEDYRKIYVDDPASHPMNQPPLRKPSSRYHGRRRPSLEVQPNLRHLLPKAERERLEMMEGGGGGERRKSRLSFDNAKLMLKAVGSFVKEISEDKQKKKEKHEIFVASIKIKLFVSRIVRRTRRKVAAKRIQKCWREYRHVVIVEKWMIAAGLDRVDRIRRETREEKVRMQEENDRKVAKRAARKAAIQAAQKAPGGYIKPPKGKKAKEILIIQGWKKKD
ncbi:hypothetical protein TrRE_jg2291, partial [Triparma retinervis]